MAHTPGPWRYRSGKKAFDIYHKAYTVARAFGDKPDHEANARLIAAAPEMHDLLVKLRAYMTGPQFDPGNRDGYAFMIETVLAKAEGR
jgi:hypothetical protein